MSPENQENSTQQQEQEQESKPKESSPPKQRARKRQGSGRRPRAPRPPKRSPLEEVLMRFAGCGRCVYFLLGYQSMAGREVLETAVADSDDEWLQLNWLPLMPSLVEKSYGLSIDQGDFYIEGCCPGCQRMFVYTTETDEELADFQISL